jgi:hypothetical protein
MLFSKTTVRAEYKKILKGNYSDNRKAKLLAEIQQSVWKTTTDKYKKKTTAKATSSFESDLRSMGMSYKNMAIIKAEMNKKKYDIDNSGALSTQEKALAIRYSPASDNAKRLWIRLMQLSSEQRKVLIEREGK